MLDLHIYARNRPKKTAITPIYIWEMAGFGLKLMIRKGNYHFLAWF